jgi:hypothetical protein
VFLADPARGNLRLHAARFVGEWPLVALVLGKKGIGLPSAYPLALTGKPPVRIELDPVRRAVGPLP